MNFKKLIYNEKERLEILELVFDKFEENKIEWLNDSEGNGYISDDTKVVYYRMISTCVHDLEISNNKDLMRFTPVEIKNLVMSTIANSPSTKRTLFSAINNYMIWAIDRGHIATNPCDVISTEGLFDVNAKVLRSNYMNLEEFYEYVDKLDADDVQKMIYVLVRYGCPIKSVPDVKYKDVDFENKIIYVLISDNLVPLPVDDEFLNRVERANACRTMLSGKGYVESEYLIKNTRTDEKLKKASVYTIVEKVSINTKIQRIDMMMLYKSRRYDFVINMAKNKKVISFRDLNDILSSLGVGSSAAQTTSFKKEVENIFDIKVDGTGKRVNGMKNRIMAAYRDGELIATGESSQKMADTLSEMGVNISRMTVNNYLKSGSDYNGITFKYKEQD